MPAPGGQLLLGVEEVGVDPDRPPRRARPRAAAACRRSRPPRRARRRPPPAARPRAASTAGARPSSRSPGTPGAGACRAPSSSTSMRRWSRPVEPVVGDRRDRRARRARVGCLHADQVEVPEAGDERRAHERARRPRLDPVADRGVLGVPPGDREVARASRPSGASAVVVLVVGAGAADHDLVLLDRDLDRAVAGPVLGVDGVVLDGGVEPQAVALLAVVERALERAARRCACACARRARACGASASPRRLGLGGLGSAASASAALRAASSAAALLLGLALLLAAGLLGLELGGDRGVVLGAQVDLLVGRRPSPSPSPSGSRPCSRLNAWICWTVTSS